MLIFILNVEFLKIPVYRGAHAALLKLEIPHDDFHGKDGFGDLSHDREPNLCLIQKEHAVMYMGRMVTENKGKIHIIAIGPLTNIALAIKLFPTFLKDVASINIMGGNYKGKCSFFN